MRPRLPLALTLILTGLFVVGMALGHATGPLRLPGWLVSEQDGPAAEAAGPEVPTSLAIPALSLRAPIRPVGLDENGAIAAPPISRAHETGWYAGGPTPGEAGAAVIVGHVDDNDGPAVFHDLTRLRPGDRIEVTRADGQVTTFRVTDIRVYDKLALPVDEVYGDDRSPELRLITCGGRWVGGDTGYADNVVVFASLVTS